MKSHPRETIQALFRRFGKENAYFGRLYRPTGKRIFITFAGSFSGLLTISEHYRMIMIS